MVDSLRSIVVGTAELGADFGEELTCGFHERYPRLLGLQPWSAAFFIEFNLFWIVVWCLSLVGLRARLRVALFPLWFLAIGMTLNGVAHPLIALAQWDYFPGLWTAPVVGTVGVLLLRRIWSFTAATR